MQTSNSRLKIAQQLFISIALMLGSIAMATETPKYSLIAQDGDFEIRKYEPRIIAEVSETGDLDTASSEGFRTLAGFIFGDNRVASEHSVIQTAPEKSKIAMTAPVTVEPSTLKDEFTMSREWRVEFTMPSQYTMASLPQPNNPSIRIKEIPSRTYAVVRYSGMNTERRINDETLRLSDWVKTKKLEVRGAPELARYNPPWTLPIFRRNEILVEVSYPEKP
jgi:effector-binding domain-containing protein